MKMLSRIKNSLFFRNRDFTLLWTGQAVSSCGGWINYVALNVLLYEITGSGSALGIFFAVRTLPSLIFGAAGGFLADRYSKKNLMIICDSVRAIAVLCFIFFREPALFYILGFILSAFDKIYASASLAAVPEIVSRKDLTEANSLSRMSQSLTAIIGPAAGGAIVGFAGYTASFATDSASFLFSVATLLMIGASMRPHMAGESKEGFIAEFKNAFSFIIASGALLSFLLLRIADGLGSGAYNTALPIFSSIHSEGGCLYGWLVTSWGIGAFLGAAAAGPLSKRIKTVRLYFCSTLLMAAGMGGTFLLPCRTESAAPYLLPILSIAAGGFGDGISGVIFSSLLMEKTPREMAGKVFGCVSSLIYMACGAGMYISGAAIDHIPLSVAVIAGTGLIALSAAAAAIHINSGKHSQ